MASYDPEFYQAPKFSAEYDESRPRQRGCFFYGCVIASILAALLLIALAVGAFFFMRFLSGVVDEWTSPSPMELPRVQIPEEDRQSVRRRVDEFRKAVESGTADEPLVLSSDNLNALIEENEDLRGKIFARIEGDKLKARVSIPLDRLGVGMLRGRYLNGEAELKASLSQGVLVVTLDSVEVNGKRLPENLLQELRDQNLAKDAYNNPRHAGLIRRFESLEIKDGRIILKPRQGGPPGEGGDHREEADTPPAEAPDEESPGADADQSGPD
ncbi:MAG: hypothetical protein U0790_15440 [Isosphaeraceae bacterium]